MSLADFEELFEADHEFDPPTNPYEEASNAALYKYLDAEGFVAKAKARKRYRRELMEAFYQGAVPKQLDREELDEIVKLSSENATEEKYLERVRGATTVIRAYCIRCVGDIPSVRNCTSVNCPLWPFRMGNNPFHGRLGLEMEDDIAFDEADEFEGEEPGVLINTAETEVEDA